MLVLSRKPKEAIVIEGGITIHVIEFRGESVRLGIEAPLPLSVHRQEVFAAIQRDSSHTPSSPKPAQETLKEQYRALQQYLPLVAERAQVALARAQELSATTRQVHGLGSQQAMQLLSLVRELTDAASHIDAAVQSISQDTSAP